MLSCKISVVLPIFNGEETLDALIVRLADVLPALSQHYELILVDDGSHDRSWEMIERFALEYPWIRGIGLMRNFGQHNATISGILAAQGDIIITMDSDGQHPPEEIGVLLGKLQEGYDVVYGYAIESRHQPWRNFLTAAAKWIIENGKLFPDMSRVSAFRAFHRHIGKVFIGCESPYPVVDVMLRWSTNKIAFVPTHHETRKGGRSSSSILRLITLMMHVFAAHSLVLVRWVECAAMAIFLFKPAIGIAIFSIGIIGEFAARNYHVALGKPRALIAKTTKDKP